MSGFSINIVYIFIRPILFRFLSQLLDLQGAFEIISLNGTFSADGRCHLHVSLSNETGKMHGGHLIELIVHTTAEVVIGECSAMVFEREHDPRTGFPELVIKDR